MPLQIQMHEAFPEDEVEAVREYAREWDRDADVTASMVTKSTTVVLIVVVFVGSQFATGFLNEAGADAYKGLKSFIKGLRARMKEESQIVLEDDEGWEIVLGPDTPNEALEHLPGDVRSAAGESQQIFWDQEQSKWTTPF